MTAARTVTEHGAAIVIKLPVGDRCLRVRSIDKRTACQTAVIDSCNFSTGQRPAPYTKIIDTAFVVRIRPVTLADIIIRASDDRRDSVAVNSCH
jgi:hypothetical protein